MSNRTSIALAALAATLVLPGAFGADRGPAPAFAAPVPTLAASGPASVRLLECSRGSRSTDRQALFRAQMDRIDGGAAMRMRFELLERVGRGPWRGVSAPGLGVWRHADPGVERFAYRQRIAALAPGTAYRARVRFRWHDASGEEVARATSRSKACRQRGPLPNVAVARFTTMPGPTPDTARYAFDVANVGRADVRGVEVALRVDGADIDVLKVRRLRAGERRRIRLLGPVCSFRAEARADPDRRLRETTDRDNARVLYCG